MKKNLLTLSIFLLGFQIYAQSLIEGVFEQKSEFIKLSENRKCKFKIGLGTIQSEQESGYVLLLFHHSIGRNNNEYSLLIKTSEESDNEVLLSKTQIQPMDKYGDAIISFYLPGTSVDLLKNHKVKQLCLCSPDKGNKNIVTIKDEIPLNNTAREFFMTYSDLLDI
ncbi:hypothetical protein [Carboxylicivirga linearis]|uniref:Uncharacterized protein n=1 Tax=Carboxylicivirga linearis TaxID=1628157 RepID=A0ABS5JRE3_9BACT|nr:hypothetical protein [Carboxylicivirga linearis]MBS2097454.1 hypothetical protein [Carboxylicivirga linearis]